MRQIISFRAAAAALLSALPLVAVRAATFESNLERAFEAKAGGTLVLDADRGSVEIKTTPADQVAVEVRRSVRRVADARAKEIFAAHEVTFAQEGDQVIVRAKIKDSMRSQLNRSADKLQVKYVISVPPRFNLDLRTAAGSITSGNIEGNVKARTAGGSLKFGDINGTFDGHTSAGSITLGTVNGAALAKTSGGSVKVGQTDADAMLETSAGSISIGSAKAGLKARTSGGSIQAGELAGAAALETSAGSIYVRAAAAAVKAHTSGGSIRINGAKSTIQAQTAAGSITAEFNGQPEENCSLVTSSGSITVKVAKGLAFNLDARATGGRVSTDLPITGSVSGERKSQVLQGKLNGGGPDLTLKTSAGDVRILKQ